MPVLSGLRLYGVLAIVLAFALVLGWGLRVDHLRAKWHAQYDRLNGEAGAVLASTRIATVNPKLRWADTSMQILLLANSRDQWKQAASDCSRKTEQLGAETARLKAMGADLRKRASSEIARRDALIRRTVASAADPGPGECEAQLKAAEDVLDAFYEAGL